MQTTSGDIARAPHVTAFSACMHKPARLIGLLLLNLLVRGVALLPLFLSLGGRNPFGFPSAHAIPLSLVACLPLYALLVMPIRFFTRATLTWVTGWRERAPRFTIGHFFGWLVAGLVRLLRALPYLVPIAALTAAFYWYWTMAGFNEFGLIINDIGALIGGDYVHGMALIALAFVLFTALAVWGWRRDLPLAFQAVDTDGLSAALARSRSVRKRRFSGLGRTTLINFLIVLPALAGVIYFLQDYLRNLMVGDLQWDLSTLLSTITTFSFPQEVYTRIGIMLVILYLPFVLWRKAALAATIGRAAAGSHTP